MKDFTNFFKPGELYKTTYIKDMPIYSKVNSSEKYALGWMKPGQWLIPIRLESTKSENWIVWEVLTQEGIRFIRKSVFCSSEMLSLKFQLMNSSNNEQK